MSLPDVALISPFPARGVVHGGTSGVASYTAHLARALRGEGAGVTVIAPVEDGEPPVTVADGIRVERAFEPGLDAVGRAARRAAGTGAPVVHLQQELFLYGGPASLAGLFHGLLYLRRRGRPAVVTAHQVVDPSVIDGSFVRMHRIGVPAVVARHALRRVQGLLGAHASTVIVHEPAFAEHVPGAVVVPHGVEAPARLGRAGARAALGIDGFVALCFGFVAPYKGLEHALAAAELAGPAVHVVVAGGDHPRLPDGRAYAEGLRARWGHIATFTGFVPSEDVEQWFAAADVVLLPYPRPHASSGALALALAYGTPVLASPGFSAAANVPQEAVVPLDPAAIARRLESLARDERALDALRSTCDGMAVGRSWSDVACRHLELYEEVSHGASAAGCAATVVPLR